MLGLKQIFKDTKNRLMDFAPNIKASCLNNRKLNLRVKKKQTYLDFHLYIVYAAYSLRVTRNLEPTLKKVIFFIEI